MCINKKGRICNSALFLCLPVTKSEHDGTYSQENFVESATASLKTRIQVLEDEYSPLLHKA